MVEKHVTEPQGPDGWPSHCARCGDRLGFYERLSCVLPDGSIVSDGLLALGARVRALGADPELYHEACFLGAPAAPARAAG